MSQSSNNHQPSHAAIDILLRICSGILSIAVGIGCLALSSHTGSTIFMLLGFVMIGIGVLALKDGFAGQKNKSSRP